MSSETVIQQQTQLEFCRLTNGVIFRNNSGACIDETGRLVRYGLGHTSAQQVREWASSDLIGITPTLIEPHMVGYHLGVFTALEIKASDWRMRPGDKRALAQEKFHTIVRAACGYAGFVTDPADILGIIGRG